jgi:dTDP-4-dehydrorhamnose reductase
MSEILILGSNGLLGSSLKKFFQNPYTPSKSDLDVEKNIASSDFFKKNSCDKLKLVINCAAVKSVEFCENNKLKAIQTNVLGNYNCAIFCNEINAKLVYISTDYVFRGDKGNYKPNDEVGPVNFYGETKLAAEIISKCTNKHLIIRLSFCEDVFPYEKAFCDQITTKMPVSEAAKKIYKLIQENASGVVHLPGTKQSVYDFAKTTKKNVKKCYLSNNCAIKRPKNTSLLG